MQKKITHILKGREKEIAPGQFVLQPLPHAEFRLANPFIVLHHMLPQTIQLWINAPAAHKLDEPFYQSAPNDLQPAVLEQEGVHLRLASGHYEDATGPLKSLTPTILISGEVSKNRRVQLTAIPGYWTLLYVINGSLCVNAETIDQHHLIVFEKENDELIVTAKEDTKLLFLSALPIAGYKAGRF